MTFASQMKACEKSKTPFKKSKKIHFIILWVADGEQHIVDILFWQQNLPISTFCRANLEVSTTNRHKLFHLNNKNHINWLISSLLRWGNWINYLLLFFSHSVLSDSLQPHGLQHSRFLALHHLLELAQTHDHESVMTSNHLVLCRPILPPSIFPSIRVFSSKLALCIRQPKSWSFNLSISPSNVYQGWLPLDWFDLLLSQGLSRVFSNTTVQKHQFFGYPPYLWPNYHIHTWVLEKQ